MQKSILNTLGIRAQRDIPSVDLFNPIALRQTYGLDEDAILRLKALKRFCHAWAEEKADDTRAKVNGSADAAIQMQDIFRDLDHEEVWVLYLNNGLKVVGRVQMSIGGLDQTVFDRRRIIKTALEADAASFVIFHNHPSGNPNPSTADFRETEALQKACQTFDIQMIDHIIFAENRYFSFADEEYHKL